MDAWYRGPLREDNFNPRGRHSRICSAFQLVARPDVVEMHDVTAQDPKLLVHLKATRNSVPVPRHWCFKRKYLQGKRGIEKPPFELPDFIKRTGIQEMREALQEKVRLGWPQLAFGYPPPSLRSSLRTGLSTCYKSN